MASLVLLDYDDAGIKQPSRSAVAAASQLGEVHVLVAGENVGAAAEAAAKLPGVGKVHVADRVRSRNHRCADRRAPAFRLNPLATGFRGPTRLPLSSFTYS